MLTMIWSKQKRKWIV